MRSERVNSEVRLLYFVQLGNGWQPHGVGKSEHLSQ